MADTPETKIKKEINKYLDSIPDLFHFPVINNGYGKGGVPDRVICYRGRFIAIEVKALGKKATPRQEQRIDEIRAAGGGASVVWSVLDVQRVIATYIPVKVTVYPTT